MKDIKLGEDLGSEPITKEGVRNLFTDGCCFGHQGKGLQAEYAVVELQAGSGYINRAASVVTDPSAQKAELKALTEALKLSNGLTVNVYTNSAYAHGVAHYELSRWFGSGFLTATGQPVKHYETVMELAEALMLPKSQS